MALLVTDQGEIDSLRTLLNATHKIPRNLVLKLYTGPSTAPTEQDVPSATKYFEPYNASNTSGYGSSATTGYPKCKNNRTEENQDFTDQYGILLNGNRWSIATTNTGQGIAKTFSGTTGTYQIVVAPNNTDLKKGDYVTGTGIPANTYVVDIDGNNIEISQKLTATATAGTACVFAVGRTTASYPEQIFTFSGAAGNVYGYYLARANNMPESLHGVVDGGTVAAVGTSVEKAGCKGVIGNDYIELLETSFTQNIASGAQNAFVIGVDAGGNLTSIKVGQRVSGTNIPTETRVSGIDGQNIYLDKPITGGNASGNATFIPDVAAELTVGQAVTKTGGGGQSGPDAFPADTTVVGIDYSKQTGEIGPKVFLSKQLTDNVGTASSNDKVDFDYSVCTSDPSGSAVSHGLNVGDVIYIAQGTTSSITAQHYTVHTVPTNSTFTTTPALSGTGDATLYSSIFFAEQFTNGPYAIQNSGDQIKVTLNVSLD
jgi:hypothetical protein